MKLVEKIYEDLATAVSGYSNVTPDLFGVAIHGHLTNGVYMHRFSEHKKLAEEMAHEAAGLMSRTFPANPVATDDIMDGIVGTDYLCPSIHTIAQSYVQGGAHVESGVWLLVERSISEERGWVHEQNYNDLLETGDMSLTVESIPAW